MNKLLLKITAILLLSGISCFSQDFYDINTIRTIHLNFYDENWDFILDTMQMNNNDDRILADIIVDGITYDSVGVRFKGNSSYHPDRIKNPFNIKIDYVKDQDIYGVKKLKLSNMFRDPSCIREVLSYEILRNYMPASKANFVFLNINGNVHGLYTNVEAVNNDFLNKHFGSDYNSFFKCDPATITGEPEPPPPGCMPVTGISSPLIILGNDTICYEQSYEIKSDYGWSNLMNMIFELNENPENVNNYLNIDRALWMLAFNNIFINLDSYTGSGHNFYVYEDDYDKFNTIIWDMNENFGAFKHAGQGPPLNPYQMIHLSPVWNIDNPARPLIEKLLNITDYRNKYFAHYRTIINDFLANNALHDRAYELHDFINNYVFNDPNLLYSYQDFINSLEQTVGNPPHEILGINQLMDQRNFFLSNHPAINEQAPAISEVLRSVEFPTPADTVWITANVTNTTGVFLNFKTNRFAPFDEIEMYDDGEHNDGNPNDNVYGAGILPLSSGTIVFYYVYTENNSAGMFSPEQAEFETYSYQISGTGLLPGSVVINEFLSDNDSTVADQDGEYDDWIELYNNTSQDISLTGMFLTDDFSQPEKWVFPDTAIQANSYLIIWADDDEDQEGLHANFKLSKSGEEIMFSDFDGIVLDSIVFGQQFADTSYGRYPNGTGDFQFMPPTFGGENQLFTYVSETDYANYIKVYPNPATDFVIIEFTGALTTKEIEIEILDLFSNRYFQTIKNSVENNVHIQVSDLSSGIYLIRMGSYYQKIIIK